MEQLLEVPEWLQDVADRYRAKPTPGEMSETLQKAIDAGFTQQQLAELFGSHQQNISRWIHR